MAAAGAAGAAAAVDDDNSASKQCLDAVVDDDAVAGMDWPTLPRPSLVPVAAAVADVEGQMT
jgi:hypothetical protein